MSSLQQHPLVHNTSLSTTDPDTARFIREQLIHTRSQTCAQVIQKVHEDAGTQYRITKKKKQAELSPRIAEAQRTGSRNGVKIEKKKVDNHASAVASRVKQDFLVTTFEALVRTKMEHANRLLEIILRQDAIIARKEMDLAVMSRHVAGLVRGKLPVGEMTSPVESEEEVALGLPKVDAIEFGEIGALVEDKFEFSPWDPFNANYVLSQRQEIIDRRQETVRARCNKDSAHDDLNPVA